MTRAPAPDDEPGAPLERTAMAWQRTGLATLAVGVLIVHTGSGSPATCWPGVLAVGAGALMTAVVAPLRYARGRRVIATHGYVSSGPIVLAAALALTAVALGVAAGLLLTPPGGR